MSKLLWMPSEKLIKQANMTRFIDFVNRQYGRQFNTYDDLYEWSIENIPDFWAAMWDFAEIKASRKYDQVVEDLIRFPGGKWFTNARMNFAENLLRYRDDRIALVFKGEDQKSAKMTYAELYNSVARLAKSLREIGVKPGDRVAAYMPNLIETAVAMLAAASVGAIWSSCGTELGAQATIDRLGQIEPRVLFTVDGYFYKGKHFVALDKAAEVVKGLPSLEQVVVVPYTGQATISSIPKSIYYEDFLSQDPPPKIEFEQLPAEHPLCIVYSSGTTGRPKCMVHSVGGVLVNHARELLLHTDLKPEDTIFYITTCSWVMWNWLLSSLAFGATIILYDGNPNYPDAGAMWKLIQDEKVTIFGTSATFIHNLMNEHLKPREKYDLSSLRQISQTGSALSAEGFEYVYQAIKEDLHFNSISGGTDVQACFAMGSPTLPVYAGELQRWALGIKCKCYDENGKAVIDQMGELVCEAPTPAMPLYFWNDANNERYLETYFRYYPGVWRHGDYIMVHSDTGGITFFGRSDALLKPSGVRIGTGEIYNEVAKLEGVTDSLAIGQQWQDDQRILLFVKLAPGYSLTDDLIKKIRDNLRNNASPRHVPARIIEVPDFPYTLNMKKVEIAVTNIIHGKPVLNRETLANPESLDYFESIVPQLQKE